jgi:hypothetical protein
MLEAMAWSAPDPVDTGRHFVATNDIHLGNDNRGNVVPSAGRCAFEAKLASLWEWEALAARYRYFPHRSGDDGPVIETDDGGWCIPIAMGRPDDACPWLIEFDGQDWILTEYELQIGTFPTLRDALEAVCPTK